MYGVVHVGKIDGWLQKRGGAAGATGTFGANHTLFAETSCGGLRGVVSVGKTEVKGGVVEK